MFVQVSGCFCDLSAGAAGADSGSWSACGQRLVSGRGRSVKNVDRHQRTVPAQRADATQRAATATGRYRPRSGPSGHGRHEKRRLEMEDEIPRRAAATSPLDRSQSEFYVAHRTDPVRGGLDIAPHRKSDEHVKPVAPIRSYP